MLLVQALIMTVGLAVSAFLLPLFFLIAPGWAQETGWEQKWDQWVSAAKKEGKVVFAGAPDPLMRKHIPERFTAEFTLSTKEKVRPPGKIIEATVMEYGANGS